MQAEVDFLGQLHHTNLVKLVGYCSEDDQRLLVYEFMTRGSLENHLFRSKLSLDYRMYFYMVKHFCQDEKLKNIHIYFLKVSCVC